MKRPSATAWALLMLALGYAAGLAAHALGAPLLLAAASWVAPFGTLWVHALQVTVVPLVFCNLLLGVAGSPDPGRVGRLGGRSLLWFVGLLVATGVLTALVVPPLLSHLPAGLSLGTPPGRVAPPGAAPTFGDWLLALMPVDPLGAAARGDILPLILLACLFALALTRVEAARREPLLAVVRAASAMVFQLLSWILAATPAAVFCLIFPVAARSGPASAGVVGVYVALEIALLAGFLVLLYPLAALAGRVPIGRFARAALAPQLVAAGTRSSLATLPSLMRAGEEGLGLAPAVTGFVLPLAVATFKLNRTVSSTAKVLFLAHVYGIPLGPHQVVAFIGAVVLTSFTTPGVPSAGTVTGIPFYLALGIPLEGVVILNAVDALPDVFKTALNVTADLAATAIVARGEEATAAPPAAPAAAPGLSR